MRERGTRASIAWVLAACVVAASPCGTRAWDGHRRGFSAGISLGPSFGYSRHAQAHLSDPQYGFGAYGFIGWATSDLLEIAFFDHLVLSGSERSDSGWSGQLALGLSVIRYLAPTSPSLFLGGGLAILGFGTPVAADGLDVAVGMALMGTLGYELGRHWGVQLSVLYGGGNDASGEGSSFFSPSASIYVRGY